jgi:hypothetical protein
MPNALMCGNDDARGLSLSYEIRAKQMWPCSVFAQYEWQFRSILEDINVLLVAHRGASEKQSQVTLLRYALIGLHAFDELTKSFHTDIKTGKVDELRPRDVKLLQDGLRAYHRTIQPFRKDLESIRHTLGAHRGLPDERQQKRFRKPFKAWGEWESTLNALEARCEREIWEPAFGAAFELDRVINNATLGRWFWTDGNRFRLWSPLRFADDASSESGSA